MYTCLLISLQMFPKFVGYDTLKLFKNRKFFDRSIFNNTVPTFISVYIITVTSTKSYSCKIWESMTANIEVKSTIDRLPKKIRKHFSDVRSYSLSRVAIWLQGMVYFTMYLGARNFQAFHRVLYIYFLHCIFSISKGTKTVCLKLAINVN